MATINAGYMGILNFGGQLIRFTDCSIAPKQEVKAPDLVMGDYNHDSWYYGAITIEGGCSGPIDDKFGTTIWDRAWTRDACGILSPEALSISYFCGDDGTMSIPEDPGAMINSLTISATAGDIGNFSFDIIAAGDPTYSTGVTGATLTESRKILTWDALGITVTTGPVTFDTDLISSFELTVTNNVTPQYTLGSGSLYPSQLVTGIRTITGSITIYNLGGNPASWPTSWDNSVAVGSIELSGLGLPPIPVNFHRIAPTAQPGPITSTVAFTGVSTIV